MYQIKDIEIGKDEDGKHIYEKYVLIKEKYYGWITFYFFMVVLPYIFIPLAFFGHILTPAILFFIYCYFLKHTVAEWLEEYDAHKGREEQKRESARLKKQEDMW